MAWSRGKPYSQDLRDRVFQVADEGHTVGETAEFLRVSVSWVSKVLSRREETGETTARPQCGHVARKLLDLHPAIEAEVATRPDATLGELRRWLSAVHQVSASEGLMHNTLVRLGLTYKKSRCTPRSRPGRTLPRRARSGASGSPI